jgi:histidinol-phosphatase (PHP family)
MLIDFHVHSNNSFDSKEPVVEMCKAAVSQNITHIAFTEHFSLDSFKKSSGFFNYYRYFSDIQEAREIFKNKLNIYTGLELCEPHLSVEAYKTAMKDFSLDYILGSVHNIGTSGLRTTAENQSAYTSYEMYFEAFYKMACFGEFNTAAHLDLMSRYANSIHGDYDFEDFEEQIREILKKLIERGKGLEVNTSGLRKDLNRLHPKLEILKLYNELGGEIITIGSDAHGAAEAGIGCRSTLELLYNLGYDYMFTFKNCKPVAHKIIW